MLLARVKQDSPIRNVTAFSGHSYNPKDWLPVPPGFENEALKHPFLETKDDSVIAAVPADPNPVPLETKETIPVTPKRRAKNV